MSRTKLGHSLSVLCNISLEYLTAGGAGERGEVRDKRRETENTNVHENKIIS